MATENKQVDYSVYLVTGRELLPPGKDYYESLQESIRDGQVTVVQLREKHLDTAAFIELAKRSLEICDKYNVRMLINDNVDVALALPNHVGLHVGQDDTAIDQARKRLGNDRLLGLSVHSVEQANAALQAGVADYVGVGPVYGTKSKAGIQESDILGPRGARQVVEALSNEQGKRMPCVLIGGINQRTAARSLFGATSIHNAPDGIAVISAIVSRPDAGQAAQELSHIVKAFKDGVAESKRAENGSLQAAFNAGDQTKYAAAWVKHASLLLEAHRKSLAGPPLIQTLTSHVSSTLSANVALAFSASPIMSHQEAEADDLGKFTGAVVLNIGTIGEEARRGMRAVGLAANLGRKPVVIDPVGVGASAFRKGVVNEIMNHTQVTLLKGNAAELSTIGGLQEVQSRGVDSGSGKLSNPEKLVRSLAQRERCLVLMTGKVDYLTDGVRLAKIYNGHELLGRITGSGCALGVTVAAGMAAARARLSLSSSSSLSPNSAVNKVLEQLGQTMVKADMQDLFAGALLGVLAMTIASELAAKRTDVKGPGSFIPALIDELAAITPEDLVKHANVEFVN